MGSPKKSGTVEPNLDLVIKQAQIKTHNYFFIMWTLSKKLGLKPNYVYAMKSVVVCSCVAQQDYDIVYCDWVPELEFLIRKKKTQQGSCCLQVFFFFWSKQVGPL